jgi:hypothetical protein
MHEAILSQVMAMNNRSLPGPTWNQRLMPKAFHAKPPRTQRKPLRLDFNPNPDKPEKLF